MEIVKTAHDKIYKIIEDFVILINDVGFGMSGNGISYCLLVSI